MIYAICILGFFFNMVQHVPRRLCVFSSIQAASSHSSHGLTRITTKQTLEEIFDDRDYEISDGEGEDSWECDNDSSGSEENNEGSKEVESFEHNSPNLMKTVKLKMWHPTEAK